MGRKQTNQPTKKQQQEQPSEEEEEEESQDFEGNGQGDDDYIDYEDEDSEAIFELIQEKIKQSEDEVKLSWAAIQNLSKEQLQLSRKMEEEITSIQKKYAALNKPIAQKIALVVAGEPVEKTLYSNPLTQTLNVNKVKPKFIQNYWLEVISKSNLAQVVNGEHDFDTLSKCRKVNCSINLEGQVASGRLEMEFIQNAYFSNNKLVIEISEQGQKRNCKEVTKILYKQKKDDDSMFTYIFQNPDKDYETLFAFIEDFHKAYTNSVKLYLSPAIQGNVEDDQQQQEQSEQKEGKNPKKKIKSDKKSEPIPKPECKQQ